MVSDTKKLKLYILIIFFLLLVIFFYFFIVKSQQGKKLALEPISINLLTSVHPNLDWNFKSVESKIIVNPGEVTTVEYMVENLSDKSSTVIATFAYFPNKFGNYINSILKNRNTGCFILRTNNKNNKINDEFLVKLSTAVSHLIGVPNHDSMSGKYYARFFVKHEDSSDSYLRKAYMNIDLHNSF